MEIFGIAGRLGFNRVGKPHRESRFLYPSQPSHTTLLVTNLPDEPKHSRISKSRISPERNVTVGDVMVHVFYKSIGKTCKPFRKGKRSP
jgi:hypothetical protein